MQDKYLPLFLLWVMFVCACFVLAERSTPALVFFIKCMSMVALIFAPMAIGSVLHERAAKKRATQAAKQGEQP